MDMVICVRGGIIRQRIVLPPLLRKGRGSGSRKGCGNGPTKGKQPWRSREQWLVEMRAQLTKTNCRYFSFRHGGRWHLCDGHTDIGNIAGMVVRAVPREMYEAAEMWVMTKESARA